MGSRARRTIHRLAGRCAAHHDESQQARKKLAEQVPSTDTKDVSPIPVAAAFGAGVPSEQLPEHNKKGFEAAPASVWDPAARLKDLHEQLAGHKKI